MSSKLSSQILVKQSKKAIREDAYILGSTDKTLKSRIREVLERNENADRHNKSDKQKEIDWVNEQFQARVMCPEDSYLDSVRDSIIPILRSTVKSVIERDRYCRYKRETLSDGAVVEYRGVKNFPISIADNEHTTS